MMKKNYTVRIFSFILCLVMLLSLSTVIASAKEGSDYVAVEWKLDEDLETLYGGEKRYTRYMAYGAFYGDADSVFYFANYAVCGDESYQVYGDSADPHIVSVKLEKEKSIIFVDSTGKKILDSFLDGSGCIYYLEVFGSTYTKISNDLVKHLDNEYKKNFAKLKTVDVRTLGSTEHYDVSAHDKTETKAYEHGAVYLMPNGSYYYVCFEDLGNNYFDSNGYFSYRSGSVPAYEITDKETKNRIDQAIADMIPRERLTIYESLVISGVYDINGNYIEKPIGERSEEEELVSVLLFIIPTVLLGIIVPAGLLVLSIVLVHSKKTSGAKCWYAVSACAALCILSVALLLVLLII